MSRSSIPSPSRSLSAHQHNAINPITGRKLTQRFWKLDAEKRRLSIWAHQKEFSSFLSRNQRIHVVGELGSGKSTQLPQWCVDYAREGSMMGGDEKKWKVVSSQPTSFAARTLAKRVADEMEVELGKEVGYRLGLLDGGNNCDETDGVLDFTTHEALLSMLMENPLLDDCLVVLVDEANKTSFASQILFEALSKLLRCRAELRVVEVRHEEEERPRYATRTPKPPTIFVDNPLFPVDMIYSHDEFYQHKRKRKYDSNSPDECGPTPLEQEIEGAVAERVKEITQSDSNEGDILIFTPSTTSMERIATGLRSTCSSLEVVEMRQDMALSTVEALYTKADSTECRRCLLVADVPESSLLFGGVTHVIDSGAEVNGCYSSVEHAFTVPSLHAPSEEAAKSRSTLAGLTGKGRYYRISSWKNYNYDSLQLTCPKMLSLLLGRLQLARLEVDCWGYEISSKIFGLYNDSNDKDILTPILERMGALNNCVTGVSELGRQMAQFPIDPQYSKALIESSRLGCSAEVLVIVSAIVAEVSVTEPCRRHYLDKGGDLLTLLKVYRAFISSGSRQEWCRENELDYQQMRRTVEICHRLKGIMSQLGVELKSMDESSPDYSSTIRRAIVAGFFAQVIYWNECASYGGCVSRSCNPWNPYGRRRTRPIDSTDLYDMWSGRKLTLNTDSVLAKSDALWMLYVRKRRACGYSEQVADLLTVVEPEWLLSANDKAAYFYLKQLKKDLFSALLGDAAKELKIELDLDRYALDDLTYYGHD